ncbi:hypothetical protein D9M72_327390 [compost metagenome]
MFATPAEINPPSLLEVALVIKFTVPPTEEIANLEDPRPRCIWIPLAISAIPDQFDQYIKPSSIPLIGWPFNKKAVLSCAKPLTETLESPKPPACPAT